MKQNSFLVRYIAIKRKGAVLIAPFWLSYPHQESNLDLKFRKLPFYPLNYRGRYEILIVTNIPMISSFVFSTS